MPPKVQSCLLLPGLLAFTSPAPVPIDRLGVKGPLTFNKATFSLAWSDKPAATYYVQEYLPQGEKPANFKQMLALHLSNQAPDVQGMVNRKITELEARKQTDVTCHYQVLSNPETKEVILDFVLSQDVGGPADITEFNVYRYRQVAVDPHHTGVLLYAYTKRAYGKEGIEFMKNLKSFRPVAIAEMAAATVPPVKITPSR